MMHKQGISRRQWLRGMGGGIAAIAGASLPGMRPLLAATQTPAAPRKRALRVAHLTDIHVQPEARAGEGLAACLRHIQSQKDAPTMLLNTGDCIMDSFKRERARTELQWKVWKDVFKAESSLPVAHAIGNHDIWGWHKQRSGTTGNEARWGKQYALDELGLAKSYHSFDRAGWHFIALDGIQPHEDGYVGRLDDEQFAWLQSDLARTNPKTPVMVMSHIPLVFGTSLPKDAAVSTAVLPPGGAMHMDYARIRDLFKQHPNVKTCISGHRHLHDDTQFAGVRYLCNGAVSGGWWKNNRDGICDPGYALIDLYDDGSVESKYIAYGWTPAVEEEPANQAA